MSSKALFLDRDGVINADLNYVYRQEDFAFLDGIFPFARLAQDAGFLLIVVTNQAGIGRGYYGEQDFFALTEWMNQRFAEQGVKITKVYHCPCHPVHGKGRYKRESYRRKPNPGMILEARDDFGLDVSSCILVGDKETDILAGQRAGVGLNILLADPGLPGTSTGSADLVVADLFQLSEWFKAFVSR